METTGSERPLIEGINVSKSYRSPERTVTVLEKANFTVETGEFVAIVGRSGTGKTTLLNLLGGVDRASSGNVLFQGRSLTAMSDKDLARFRNETVGFVFQNFFLRTSRTALENVMVPLLMGDRSISECRDKSRRALERVGLGSLVNEPVSRLSGGQKQRVAIARAMAPEPKLLLADEPSGSLDTETSVEIYDLLKDYNDERRATLVIVTHDPLVERFHPRKVTVEEGKLVPYDRPI